MGVSANVRFPGLTDRGTPERSGRVPDKNHPWRKDMTEPAVSERVRTILASGGVDALNQQIADLEGQSRQCYADGDRQRGLKLGRQARNLRSQRDRYLLDILA